MRKEKSVDFFRTLVAVLEEAESVVPLSHICTGIDMVSSSQVPLSQFFTGA
jgi:hypothetical protein